MRKMIVLALALAFAGASSLAAVPDTGSGQQMEKGHKGKKK